MLEKNTSIEVPGKVVQAPEQTLNPETLAAGRPPFQARKIAKAVTTTLSSKQAKSSFSSVAKMPPIPVRSRGSKMFITEHPRGLRTLRLRNLPTNTQEVNIRKFLKQLLPEGYMGAEIGPLHHYNFSSLLQTTVSFREEITAKKATKFDLKNLKTYDFGIETARHSIEFDAQFLRLTTIYEPTSRDHTWANIDIIAVHGLGGHPWMSWAARRSSATKEPYHTWLEKDLPPALAGHGIHPRVMTYGWNSATWLGGAFQSAEQETSVFIADIRSSRLECPERPLYFICHSLGGILVKQVILGLNSTDKVEKIPVLGCIFFSTPHKMVGMQSILSNIRETWLTKGTTNFALHKELETKSKDLQNISDSFDSLRAHSGLHVISFYETKSTNDYLVVPKGSAILDQQSDTSMAINANHRNISRFGDSASSELKAAISLIADLFDSTLPTYYRCPKQHQESPGQSDTDEARDNSSSSDEGTDTDSLSSLSSVSSFREEAQQLHDHFEYLEKFDTIFVIDDSASMAGTRWIEVKEAVIRCARIVLAYDMDGVDIYFLNSSANDVSRVHALEHICAILDSVQPHGSTPIDLCLDEIFYEYLHRFKKAGSLGWVKPVNIIVLTDGAPDEGIWDLRHLFVRTAHELEILKAPRLQLGVQFVQIGDDEGASAFLSSLDEFIMSEHGLDRDMIDVVKYDAAHADDSMFKKILLGSIWPIAWDKD